MMASTGPGMPGARSRGGVAGRAMWQWIHSIGSDAENGSDPVIIS